MWKAPGGRGISDAFGLAGFTNLDVVRNPTLGSKPYIARAMIRQIIPLSGKRVGKFGLADFFDLNEVGGDSHLQFLNWTVDNNGGAASSPRSSCSTSTTPATITTAARP